MPKIFISYRRQDKAAAANAGRLYDRLVGKFGEESVFMDVDKLRAGTDFVKDITQKVGDCDCLIAMIGEDWLTATDERGGRRLDNPEDWVRLEIATALKRDVTVIPALVYGTPMPRSKDLPRPLKKLARRQAVEITHRTFHRDVAGLIRDLAELPENKEAGTTKTVPAKKAVRKKTTKTKKATQKNVKLAGFLGDFVNDLRDEAAYVEIPAGEYPVGKKREKYTLKRPILVARCPTTNSQFELFIEDKGYDNEGVWSQLGWTWKIQGKVSEPGYWRSSEWNKPSHPVVGVSWFEAEAFCNWAKGRLPNRLEWSSAAGGPKGFEYPWGAEWEDGICNTREAGVHATSAVGQFPRSRSKNFGLEDMAGNVREWCADGGTERMVHGGSWADYSGQARGTVFFGHEPGNRYRIVGFRVMRDAVSRTR